MPVTVDELARDAARFMAGYAKGYGAGAFATPTRKEIAADPFRLQEWRDAGGRRVIGWGSELSRPSVRNDWTGRPFTLGSGAGVLTHLAREQGADVPNLAGWDYVFAYVEDTPLTLALYRQQRVRVATRITAASELLACWGRAGVDAEHQEAAHDLATVTRLPLEVDGSTREAIAGELAGLSGWHDDFPYYSDGSWAALSLRGFRPDDPKWGIKPAEMPRKWQEAHPEALGYRCDWTVLATATPTLRELVERVDWWGGLERVRLLRMAGRGGRGGKLARHTDITDRAAGLGDGQVARFHIPLHTHPDITMTSWDLEGGRSTTHLPPFTLWYLDARKPHAVTNPTGVDRVHLVVDVAADATVRDRIAEVAA